MSVLFQYRPVPSYESGLRLHNYDPKEKPPMQYTHINGGSLGVVCNGGRVGVAPSATRLITTARTGMVPVPVPWWEDRITAKNHGTERTCFVPKTSVTFGGHNHNLQKDLQKDVWFGKCNEWQDNERCNDIRKDVAASPEVAKK